MGIGKIGRLALVVSAVSGVVSAPLAAADKTPEVLKGGPWNVYYADDTCRLSRMFGEGDARIGMRMEWFVLGGNAEMMLSGPKISTGAIWRDIDFAYGPGLGPPVKVRAGSGTLADGIPMILFWAPNFRNRVPFDPDQVDSSPITPADEAAVREQTVTIGKRTVVLRLGSMAPPMDSVRTCLSSLVAGWGVNPADRASIATGPQPKTSPEKWIVSADYPRAALRSGEQATVHFRLMVDTAGMPTACRIQAATKGTGFNEATCRQLMKRARFEPARTADNRAVPWYYISSVRFIIP